MSRVFLQIIMLLPKMTKKRLPEDSQGIFDIKMSLTVRQLSFLQKGSYVIKVMPLTRCQYFLLLLSEKSLINRQQFLAKSWLVRFKENSVEKNPAQIEQDFAKGDRLELVVVADVDHDVIIAGAYRAIWATALDGTIRDDISIPPRVNQ